MTQHLIVTKTASVGKSTGLPLMTNQTVISGFPGVGKSFLVKRSNGHDSDSSDFSWMMSPDGRRVRNPEFPHNYIEHIKKLTGVVFVSSHKEVRDALAHASIPFVLCHPSKECKEEYIGRYRERGSPDAFITLLETNWDNWIDELQNESRCTLRMVLGPGMFLSDVFRVF